jgi:phosphoribosylanthranilate isomerase
MSLWIKICANTTLEDARLAVEAGADAVGFVFAPSPRQVTAAQVAAIAPHLPGRVEKIGVFVHAGLEEIYATVRETGLTGVQLHSAVGPELTARLRRELGAALRILRVVHFGPEAAAEAATVFADPCVDAVLVDSRTLQAVGGTGIAFDWSEARRTLFQDGATFRDGAARKPLIAAGGISPANVAEAVATLQPWGVDVASGVEAAPGRKDPEKVWEFVARARAAAEALLPPRP